MSQQTTTQWQAFLDTAKAKYATACDVYQTALNDADATMELLTAAQDAYNAAGAQWAADQHTANQMAAVEPTTQDFATMTTAELREYAETVQAEYDADELTGPMGRQIVRDAWARVEAAEAAEATTPTAAQYAAQYAALDALYDAVIANRAYAKLATKAEKLGVNHCVINKVIAKAEKDSPNPITTPRTAWERKTAAMIAGK